MNTIGWFLASLHQLVGHTHTAICLGMPSGDQVNCLLCQYEKDPTPERQQAVIVAIGRAPRGS